ncbi:MAG TPA: prepilin-type N-terminal cleavage/methylation domain-containing protein [Candidatus Paceibacterota bacterium]
MIRDKGFTFIEVIVSVTLLLVIVISSYQGYAAIYTAIAHSHYRMTAADLANEQFEIIKNLPYTSVGTGSSTPTGIVPVTQVLNRGSINYTVATTIQGVNDPFDGAPDTFPNDYKLVEIRVTCQSCKNFTPIVITGRVAPANLESS